MDFTIIVSASLDNLVFQMDGCLFLISLVDKTKFSPFPFRIRIYNFKLDIESFTIMHPCDGDGNYACVGCPLHVVFSYYKNNVIISKSISPQLHTNHFMPDIQSGE